MNLSLSANPLNITEQTYGIGSRIHFSNFTSCIGLVARCKDAQLIGVHLVLVPEGHGGPMLPNDVGMVGAVLTRLGYVPDTLHIVGYCDIWNKSAQQTLTELAKLGRDTEFIQEGDQKKYGAHLLQGKIEITH